MIQGKSILAIIPARGGSKAIHRKNIKELCGKPLLAWTIASAQESKYIDRLILSSEDEEIIAVAKQYNCEVPFIRPKELSQDNTSGMAPVLHAITSLNMQYHYTMLLQATSPLRSVEDIDDCIEYVFNSQVKSCVSVTESQESPYWMFKLDKDNKMMPIMKVGQEYETRQDLPKIYIQNGAIYIAETAWLLKNKDFQSEETIGYIMAQERSVDIDYERDFFLSEYYIFRSKDVCQRR